jgi:hypothetical protein
LIIGGDWINYIEITGIFGERMMMSFMPNLNLSKRKIHYFCIDFKDMVLGQARRSENKTHRKKMGLE